MGRRPVTPSVGFVNQFRQQRMAPGGRRWSESPIPDPACRRPRARGAAPECPFPLYPAPDAITIDNTESAFTWSLVGGAGDATLGDGLDSTYVRCTYPSSSPGGGPFSVGFFFEFEAVSLPAGATVTKATLGARVRSSTAGTLLQYAVAGDILDTYTPLYTEATGAAWSAGTDWANKTDLTTWTNTPTPAQLAAGAIQGYILPAATYTDGRTFDIAGVWLTIEGTC